jgi:transcriptional regulator with XRE-family HTH domain
VEIQELGSRLRARRTGGGETIAAVAIRAGLSVPYIANLENGRGNPTLATLSALAQALGAELRVDLVEPGDPAAAPAPVARPATLTRFAQEPRFAAETNRLATRAARTPARQRETLLDAMSAVAAAVPGEFTELDWHRVLDAVVLIARG